MIDVDLILIFKILIKFLINLFILFFFRFENFSLFKFKYPLFTDKTNKLLKFNKYTFLTDVRVVRFE